MGWAFGMLLFDTVLYIALILYYDYSEEAKSKKSSGSDASARADDGDYHVSHGQITGLKTDSAESAAVGIRVRKLSKLYGEPAACGKESTLVHAVKGIDFDVPEKHIFALLGHNGVSPRDHLAFRSLSQCGLLFQITGGQDHYDQHAHRLCGAHVGGRLGWRTPHRQGPRRATQLARPLPTIRRPV